jgi:hypothetical protein
MKFSDLLTQDLHDQGAEMNVIDPMTDKHTDLFITVAGMDSKLWQKLQKTLYRKLLEARDKALGDGLAFDVEDFADIPASERLARATIGWRGFTDDDGKDMPFSYEKCEELYTKAPSVCQQVNEFLGNRGNFTKG